MKQNVPLPVVIAIGILVLGGVGFLLWHQFTAPTAYEKPFTPPAMSRPTGPPMSMSRPLSKEDGMKMYRQGH